MLKQLRFQNFKSWKDTGEMQLAPLTGLFGTNSSGKTAILQFLLMLKQTTESADRQRVLHTGDFKSYVDLGSTQDFVYRHFLPSQLKFSLVWDHQLQDFPLFLPSTANTVPERSEAAHLDLTLYSSDLKFEALIDLKSESLEVKEFSYQFIADEQGKNPHRLGFRRSNNSNKVKRYSLIAEGKLVEDLQIIVEDLRTTRPSIDKQDIPIRHYGFPGRLKLNIREGNWMENLVLAYEKNLQSVYYLRPLREYPRRTYLWSGERPQDVGKQGENAIAVLLAARKQNPEIELTISHWLKKLGLVHNFKLQAIAEGRREYEVRIQKDPKGPYVTLPDVGFGVSQVLPVLILCYTVPEGSTILLEQPEIHLHPSAQSELADVFIDVIKTRNVQIILESHSEHLLHRLQRRIAEEDQGFTNEDAALYFCQTDEEGASYLTHLKLNEYGSIENWPKDFFGDRKGDLFAMTEAAMLRQLAHENSH